MLESRSSWPAGLAAMGLAIWLPAIPARAAADPLTGSWDTPLGNVRIEARKDGYVGILEKPGKLCRFPANTEVLRGTQSDGTFTGELRLCPTSKGCAKEVWILAMLMPAAADADMRGAVALTPCVEALLPSAKLSFKRGGAAAPRGQKSSGREALEKGEELLSSRQYKLALAQFQAAARSDAQLLAEALIDQARAFSFMGEKARALRALREAADAGAGLEHEEDFRALKGEPEYKEIRKQLSANAKRSRAGRR